MVSGACSVSLRSALDCCWAIQDLISTTRQESKTDGARFHVVFYPKGRECLNTSCENSICLAISYFCDSKRHLLRFRGAFSVLLSIFLHFGQWLFQIRLQLSDVPSLFPGRTVSLWIFGPAQPAFLQVRPFPFAPALRPYEEEEKKIVLSTTTTFACPLICAWLPHSAGEILPDKGDFAIPFKSVGCGVYITYIPVCVHHQFIPGAIASCQCPVLSNFLPLSRVMKNSLSACIIQVERGAENIPRTSLTFLDKVRPISAQMLRAICLPISLDVWQTVHQAF